MQCFCVAITALILATLYIGFSNYAQIMPSTCSKLLTILLFLVAVYQTDFSVTNRLLPPYNNTGTSSLPVPSVTISYRNGGSFQSGHPSGMPGWHSMIHTDQESISPKNYPQVGWRGPTAGPNLLPHISQGSVYPTVGYGGGEGPAPPSYPDQSPDSSTGLVSFSPKGDKENTMSHHAGVPGPSLSSGDKLGMDICRRELVLQCPWCRCLLIVTTLEISR